MIIKLLNTDAIALWIRHRTVIFTDTKIILNEIHIASDSFFSISAFCCILSHYWSDYFNYNFYNRFA